MRILFVFLSFLLGTISCSDVAFHSISNSRQGCQGQSCPNGTYAWHIGTYGMCSKPCGGGSQTRPVECRRSADNVVVGDDLCPTPKPVATQDCNVQACAGSFAWNVGPFGDCSKDCGGGTKTRPVVCQDQSGTTVADSNCTTPKPSTTEVCNTNTCPSIGYQWHVTPGPCSKECGGGTATDVVVCKRTDGVTVADSFCNATTKPPTTRACNLDPCPQVYTYAWEAGPWSACSKDCGPGIQTRSVACRRNDLAYVAENFCAALPKPPTEQPCQVKACPTGRKVTQTAYVTPASNSVDVILIVDDSGSMKEDQAKLASRMNGLLLDLDALKIDYQVCLTTTDISYYKGSPIKWQGLNSFIMTKNSPNKNQVFVNTINALGAQWSSDEQAIKATYLMARDFRAAGCIRPQAALTAIVISDENERSVGGVRSLSSAQYQPLTFENYPDNLIAYIKTIYDTSTFKKPFTWNSIIVKPYDYACEAIQDAQTSPSFFGTLYADLSNKTGGHIGSICDNDYAQNLKYIKDRVVNSMPGLTMECVPIDNPVVTFDQPVSTTITVTGNQIKFTPALSEGVRVTAVYTCPN